MVPWKQPPADLTLGGDTGGRRQLWAASLVTAVTRQSCSILSREEDSTVCHPDTSRYRRLSLPEPDMVSDPGPG